MRGLTFELSGRQRQDARPGPVKMHRVPPARAWWPAVGAPLERGVRHHSLYLESDLPISNVVPRAKLEADLGEVCNLLHPEFLMQTDTGRIGKCDYS